MICPSDQLTAYEPSRWAAQMPKQVGPTSSFLWCTCYRSSCCCCTQLPGSTLPLVCCAQRLCLSFEALSGRSSTDLLILQALGSGLEVEGTAVVAIFGRFLYVFVASLMVGVGFGLGTAILLKVLRSHSAPQVSQHRCITQSMTGSNSAFTCGQLVAALPHSDCLVFSCRQAGWLPGIAVSCSWLPAAAAQPAWHCVQLPTAA